MDADKVSVRFVSASTNEVLRICDKYHNVVCWPTSILFFYVVLVVRRLVSGRVKGTGDGLNLERLVLVVV